MKPYVSYKPSGVPWLGDVPRHWDGKRLRDCVEGCSNGVWGDEPGGGEDDIPVIRVADFDRDRRRVVEYETVRKVDSSQRGSRGLIPGDMLMEKSGGGEQQPVGMVVSYLVPEDAVCSNFVARMRSREGVVSRFMVYLHAYLYASRVTNISVKQTTGIQNLDSTAYLSEACFVPPPDEQQAIADYLDIETARIDTLIHEKNELIGLLREWRQSVIAEAVTKGLDKSAATKPSGVPWLGDVPKHWVGKRLRDCVEGCSNGVWGDEPDGGDDDIPVIRVADFDRNRRQVVDYETLRKVDSGQRGSRGLRPGDMLMEKSGGGEQQPVGMVVSYFGPEGAVCSNFVARMRSREGVVSRFMVYLHAYLYASRVTNISVKQTTGIQNLDSTAYLSEACFVPPPDEQQAIADYLDTEAVKIDDLIDHTHDEITLLKELRAATIADAVLGRVDVRTKT
ncbi:restriction endonuclease subunit S [Comamonas aquatica]|uniref:restriction endonuclease subunit S n=1 Tax=Comamonas aquatica TaxID=225991 RepID=UPI0021B0CDBB|nr:restriction endonuclease subunit S [Comamonas aquatica]